MHAFPVVVQPPRQPGPARILPASSEKGIHRSGMFEAMPVPKGTHSRHQNQGEGEGAEVPVRKASRGEQAGTEMGSSPSQPARPFSFSRVRKMRASQDTMSRSRGSAARNHGVGIAARAASAQPSLLPAVAPHVDGDSCVFGIDHSGRIRRQTSRRAECCGRTRLAESAKSRTRTVRPPRSSRNELPWRGVPLV
ncbi:hypothetical protein RJ55_00654 [Drechmeria coniospora]|nr:hypothetical protein RJ55_00654 [Drechmeria coniospora]